MSLASERPRIELNKDTQILLQIAIKQSVRQFRPAVGDADEVFKVMTGKAVTFAAAPECLNLGRTRIEGGNDANAQVRS